MPRPAPALCAALRRQLAHQDQLAPPGCPLEVRLAFRFQVRCDHCRDYREEQVKDPDAIPDHVARKLSDKELQKKRCTRDMWCCSLAPRTEASSRTAAAGKWTPPLRVQRVIEPPLASEALPPRRLSPPHSPSVSDSPVVAPPLCAAKPVFVFTGPGPRRLKPVTFSALLPGTERNPLRSWHRHGRGYAPGR